MITLKKIMIKGKNASFTLAFDWAKQNKTKAIIISLALIIAITSISLLARNEQISNVNQSPNGMVYVTATGDKYHRENCTFLKQSKIGITIDKAKQKHFPCTVCNPPTD